MQDSVDTTVQRSAQVAVPVRDQSFRTQSLLTLQRDRKMKKRGAHDTISTQTLVMIWPV